MKRKNLTILIFTLLLFTFYSSLYAQGTFTPFKFQCNDSLSRPYVLYTPQDIDKSKKQPLLVYLHGGISRKTIIRNPLKYAKQSKLINIADEGNFYILFCFGDKDATWFDKTGVDMVLKEIDEVKNNFMINTDQIILSGFSDGGSGALYFSMTNPSIFAGFISLNGNLRISNQVGFYDLYPANMNHKPIYIINTKNDPLYPIHQIRQSVEYLKEYNKNIKFKEVEGKHEINYITQEKSNLIEFIHNSNLQKADSLKWETSNTSMNSQRFLEIIELDTFAPQKSWHHKYKLEIYNDKAEFGALYDFKYRKGGLRVKSFQNDTCTARRIGIELNDIILAMDKDSMISPYSSRSYVASKKAGDKITISLIRDNKRLQINGTFNEGYINRIFDHKSRSGKVTVSLNNNELIVNTSRVSKCSINFDQLTTPVNKLIVNNETYPINLSGIQIIEIK